MLFWICLLLVLLPLMLEGRLLRAWRARIPCRVHVHGTRGKSAVVRRLAALLRARGLRVLAKTTGDAPEYILPDGSVSPVRRTGPASIREHVRILRMAAAMRADVLVVEGMALQRENVLTSEHILHATHAVITNLRPDHEETMGRGRKGVLRTLSLMIPPGKTLYCAQETGAPSLAENAAARGTACRIVSSGLSAPHQPEALARAVAGDITGKRSLLSAGDLCHTSAPCGPDPRGKAVPLPGGADGMPGFFLDLFSVNDVVSTRMLLARGREEQAPRLLRAALLSTRADRPLRTTAFMAWLIHEPFFDIIVAAGDHAPCALWYGALLARRRGLSPSIMSAGALGGRAPETLLADLARKAREKGRSGLFVAGVGIAHGYAECFRVRYGGSSCS